MKDVIENPRHFVDFDLHFFVPCLLLITLFFSVKLLTGIGHPLRHLPTVVRLWSTHGAVSTICRAVN